jgi:hypothetical protein
MSLLTSAVESACRAVALPSHFHLSRLSTKRPLQAMARIAATEEVDGIRDEGDVGGPEEQMGGMLHLGPDSVQ